MNRPAAARRPLCPALSGPARRRLLALAALLATAAVQAQAPAGSAALDTP